MHADLLPWLVAGSVALAVLGSGWLAYGLFLKTQRTIIRQRRFARYVPRRWRTDPHGRGTRGGRA